MSLLFSFRGNYYDTSCRESDEKITALMAGDAIDLSVSGYAAKRSSVCGHPLRGQIENMDRIGAAFANIQLRVVGRKCYAVGLQQGIIRKDGSVAVIHRIIQPFEIQLSVFRFDAVIRIGEVYDSFLLTVTSFGLFSLRPSYEPTNDAIIPSLPSTAISRAA